MNTTTTNRTYNERELTGLITEFDLDRRYDYEITDEAFDFADACCDGNTIAELSEALRAGVEHWTCAPTCYERGMTKFDWLAGLSIALSRKVFSRLDALELE